MNADPISPWAAELQDLEARALRRTRRVIDSPQGAYVTVGDRQLCCLASNNYLGLANHPRIIAAVQEAVAKWGWGAGASQLVCGYMRPHQQLESRLAAFKGTEAALVCSTGYQANLVAIRGLAGEGDAIFLDKLDHASIIDAARASGATLRVFPHRNYDKLERLLQSYASARRRVIVTDSLFSMDGDLANLPRLVELKPKYDALLCIDEAHATGVLGAHGRGAAELMGVESDIDVTVGTLSKALGGIGGFIAASREIIDWLVNTGRAFIYTTALPPAACVAAIAALDIVASDEGRVRREGLLRKAARLRESCRGHFATPGAGGGGGQEEGETFSSQIMPVVVGASDAALSLAKWLEDGGFLVPAIRPPTVPPGTARLRVSLCCEHTDADLDRFAAALEKHARSGHNAPR